MLSQKLRRSEVGANNLCREALYRRDRPPRRNLIMSSENIIAESAHLVENNLNRLAGTLADALCALK